MDIGQALIRVSEQMLDESEPEQLYNRIVQIALDELRADCTLLMLWDQDSDRIDVVAAAGLAYAMPDALARSLHGSIADWALRQRQPLLLTVEGDLPADLRDRLPGDLDRSALSVPLIARDQIFGALVADWRRTADPFGAADRDLAVPL